MNNYMAALILAVVTGWHIYKDIKKSKDERERYKKSYIYAGMILVFLVGFFAVTTFARPMLDKMFYAMGGRVVVNGAELPPGVRFVPTMPGDPNPLEDLIHQQQADKNRSQ